MPDPASKDRGFTNLEYTIPLTESLGSFKTPSKLKQTICRTVSLSIKDSRCPMMEARSDLIYDVGLYDGGDTAYYLFRGYNVVAVDAKSCGVIRH